MNKNDFIEIAINWLKEHADDYTWFDEEVCESGMTDDFYDEFKKAMLELL